MISLDLKLRTEYLREIGLNVAPKMSKALQDLTGEKIKVDFGSVKTFEQSKLIVDLREKCFGSFVSFKSQNNNVEGIVVATFPLSSSKTFIDLLLKRYLNKLDQQTLDPEMRLSAFKEALNILLSIYIAGVANVFKIKLDAEIAKFVCFRNVKFIEPALLKKYSKSDSFVSAGQFRIVGDAPDAHLRPVLKAALLSYFNLNFENTLKR